MAHQPPSASDPPVRPSRRRRAELQRLARAAAADRLGHRADARRQPEVHDRDAVGLVGADPAAPAREDDGADGGDEQQERGDLEREQELRQQQLADRARACRRPASHRGAPSVSIAFRPEPRTAMRELDEQRQPRRATAIDAAGRGRPAGAAAPVRAADVGDDEHVEHHHGAGVDDDLRGGDELRAQQQEQRRQREQVADEREHGVEGVAQHHDPDRAADGADARDEEEDLGHADAGGYSPSRAQRRALERLGEQHLLGEDQVGAVVVGHLVVVAHRDRVERARDLAVAAEDAAREVDLVDRGVALAGRRRGARACSRRRRRGCSRPGRRRRTASSRRTSPGPCPRSGAACGGRGSAGRPAPSPRGTGSSSCPRRRAAKRRLQAAQRLAEGAVGAAGAAGLRAAR